MSADSKNLPPSDPFGDVPPDNKGWWLRIFTPEESERMFREEARIPIEEFVAKLERKYGYHFDA